MNKDKVSIIVLNWNGWKDTLECLASLVKIDYPNYEIIVVDNNSSGDDINIIQRDYGDKITLIKNNGNYGFAEGNNIAIREIITKRDSRYILLLNNDTIVKGDFLTELVNVMEKNEKVVIVGPKMLYYEYKNRKDIIWFGGGIIDWKRYPGYHHVDQFISDKEIISDKAIQTDWISGACMLMDISLINPILNSDFYFGCEDIDKCLEVKKNGFKIFYVPNSIIWHKVSSSREKTIKSKISNIRTNFRLLKKNKSFWIFFAVNYCVSLLFNSFKKMLTR